MSLPALALIINVQSLELSSDAVWLPNFYMSLNSCSAYNRFFFFFSLNRRGEFKCRPSAAASSRILLDSTNAVSHCDSLWIADRRYLHRLSSEQMFTSPYTTTFVRYAVGLRCKEDVLTLALSIVISRSKMYSHLNTVCCARNTNRCCTVSWTVFFTYNNIRIHWKENSKIRNVAGVADKR